MAIIPAEDTTPGQESVGLIGLGLLGSALAQRLREAGYRIVGYDLDPARRTQLAADGCAIVESADDVARSCERVILCLPDSHVVASVVTEIRPQLSPRTLLIDTTTGDPEQTAQLGEQLAAGQIPYVDATIAGSSEQLRAGDVLLMVGGEAVDVRRCEDLFAAIARQTIHVGSWGSGARMKLVVNLVLGLNRAVLAEGLEFARAIGIDPRQALEVLRASPAASRVMDTKGERMLNEDFTPQARLRQHLKDVGLILETAEKHDQFAPLSTLHAELLRTLVDRGLGELDNAAIIRAFQAER